ncbi:MAG: hypothetical protein KBT11_09255 [Treponema sp.]|nr:hypothetical protein [Candidatus Treponema equifaecale]
MSFKIKITDIFQIRGRGQIICGDANEENYRGTLICEGKTYKVLGSPAYVPNKKPASYLIDTFDLDDSFIGKEFIEDERE